MKKLSYEERKNKHQVPSRAMLDVFWSWVYETADKYTTNKKLTEAPRYARNQKRYPETLFEDRRLVFQ